MNFFKSKMKRTGQTADADIHKQVLNSNYDMLGFGKEQDKLDYKLSACCNPILEIQFWVCHYQRRN
jgi:GTP pyrophosphokinase